MYQEMMALSMTMSDLENIFNILLMILLGIIATPVVFVVMAGTALLMGRISRRFLTSRTRRHYLRNMRTVVAEYEPPFDLRPAEIAYLYDTTMGEEEVLATIFDLERRGYVMLTPVKEKDDFLIHLTDDHEHTKLHGVDSHVLAMIGSKGRRWRALQKDAERLLADGTFGRVIEQSLTAIGLLRAHGTKSQQSLFVIIVKSVVSAVAVGGACALIYTGAPLIIGVLVIQLAWMPFLYQDLIGYARKSARTSGDVTPLLAKVWPQIEGFCEFVKVVELDRIKFTNQDTQGEYQHALLPYAIALNLPTHWQNRFK